MQSRADQEFERDLKRAISRILLAGNEEFGTSFRTWQELGDYLFEKDPNLCFDLELRITDELVGIQSAKGLNAKHCAVMEREGKRKSTQSFLEYWRQQYRKGEAENPPSSVLDAHLLIVGHIQHHGKLFLQSEAGEAIAYATEETTNLFGITQEVMADQMLKLMPDVPNIEIGENGAFGSALECVAQEANRPIQWACYRQYEYLAHYCSPKGVERETLSRIRDAWNIPDFLAEEDNLSSPLAARKSFLGRLSQWLIKLMGAR